MTRCLLLLLHVLWSALVARTIVNWAGKHDMTIYTRNAGPTLAGLMCRASELAKTRTSLEQEIALARATLIRVVSAWDAVLDKPEAPEELKLHCESVIKDTVDLVAKLVHTDAKTRLLDEGAIQLSSVSYVTAEVTRAIEEIIRERDPDLADKLVERIGKIKLPEDGTVSKFINKARDEAFL